MRLFLALTLPEAALARLASLRLRLSTPTDGLRWSSPEQWHITLQFYGEVTPDQIPCLTKALAKRAEAVAPLRLVIEELGLFASKGILFASVTKTPLLLSLHEQILEAAAECELLSESRPFHPHVTLARSKGKTGHKTLQRLSSPKLPPLGQEIAWQATELVLMESELSAKGASYSLYATIPLGGGEQGHTKAGSS